MHFPYRHLDRTKIEMIGSLDASMEYVQVRGIIVSMEVVGERRSKRLIVHLRDKSGTIEMAWFQGITWVQKALTVGNEYLVFGRLSFFLGRPQLSHPEIESLRDSNAAGKAFLEPIYPVTEKLKARGLNAKAIAKLVQQLF